MTNKEMLCTALKQSALELNCTVDDLTGGEQSGYIKYCGGRKEISFAAVLLPACKLWQRHSCIRKRRDICRCEGIY